MATDQYKSSFKAGQGAVVVSQDARTRDLRAKMDRIMDKSTNVIEAVLNGDETVSRAQVYVAMTMVRLYAPILDPKESSPVQVNFNVPRPKPIKEPKAETKGITDGLQAPDDEADLH